MPCVAASANSRPSTLCRWPWRMPGGWGSSAPEVGSRRSWWLNLRGAAVAAAQLQARRRHHNGPRIRTIERCLAASIIERLLRGSRGLRRHGKHIAHDGECNVSRVHALTMPVLRANCKPLIGGFAGATTTSIATLSSSPHRTKSDSLLMPTTEPRSASGKTKFAGSKCAF